MCQTYLKFFELALSSAQLINLSNHYLTEWIINYSFVIFFFRLNMQ